MHEDPSIPNYRQVGRGPKLQKGMVIAVEPMITAGSYKCRVLKDGWTAVTRDGSNAAHYAVSYTHLDVYKRQENARTYGSC